VSPAPVAAPCPFRRAGVAVTPYPWPLCNVLELAALPSAVPCARLHARHLLREWLLDGLAETTELLTSELVTNAVHAMAGQENQPTVGLRLSTDHVRVLIEVWDADPQPLAPRHPGEDEAPAPEAEGGRGLFLVSALSARWNWYLTQQPEGKVVWCELEDERPDDVVSDRSPGQSYLPRRIPGAVHIRPAAARHDPHILRRLRDGLRNLDRGGRDGFGSDWVGGVVVAG
jgi:anti-sigma regulatory factor (Ser/Thr protein kinase)